MKKKLDKKFFDKAAESICSVVRQDHYTKYANHEIDPGEFVSKFKKQFRLFLSTLPDQDAMYDKADAIVNDVSEIAWLWCGKNIEGLMEINKFFFEDLGFTFYEWDPDDGMYVEFTRQTESTDYFLTVSRGIKCENRFPFRPINKTAGLAPTNVKVTLTAYHKNRFAENYKKDVKFQNLELELDNEYEFLLVLLKKFER